MEEKKKEEYIPCKGFIESHERCVKELDVKQYPSVCLTSEKLLKDCLQTDKWLRSLIDTSKTNALSHS